MSGLGAVPPDLAAQVSAFTARLRDRHGFLIGPGETADALRALGAVDVLARREVRGALRAVLSASPEQLRLFDLEFNAFFRVEGAAQPKLPPLLPETKAPGREEQTDAGQSPPPGPGQPPAPKPTPAPDDAPDPDEDAPDSQAPGQPLPGEETAPRTTRPCPACAPASARTPRRDRPCRPAGTTCRSCCGPRRRWCGPCNWAAHAG
ncbi:hypothetical protein ACFQDE_08460 [Deinococcus caeni]|uniref:hypothetical protein n=1 Tax=Deinococcus caeni TaxID=569127 RepID=UPI00361BE1C0